MSAQACVHIREIQSRKDIRSMLAISAESAITPLSENDIFQDNTFVFLVEHSKRILAYLIVRLHGNRLLLVDIAVRKDFRRHGIGSQLFVLLNDLMPHKHAAGVNTRNFPPTLIDLKNGLAQVKCRSINLMVRETNLRAQKFFHRLGFSAGPKIHWGYFRDTGEDGYFMSFDLSKPQRVSHVLPKNRIAKFGFGLGF